MDEFRVIDDFHGMPGYLIRRAQQISTALFAEECGGFDLTAVQYAALSAISRNAGLDATRLSQLICFDRSTLGDVLERMETKGWVVRTGSVSDRRIKVIGLSPTGQSLLDQVEPAVRRVQERLLAPFTKAERDTLLALLTRLDERLQGVEG